MSWFLTTNPAMIKERQEVRTLAKTIVEHMMYRQFRKPSRKKRDLMVVSMAFDCD